MRHDLTFTNGDVSLAGTLWLPEGPGPHPALVMVGGSGPTDRDNDVLFPPIRAHLVGAGFAVASYDKRGVGGSSGDWMTARYDDLAADAAAAVRALRDRAEVDAGSVGLFGHSEGGWVALRAAALADPAYVVTNSGPGVGPARQERWAMAAWMRADAVPEPEIEACAAVFDRIVAAAERDTGFAEVHALVRDDPAYQRMIEYGRPLDEALWTFMKLVQDHDPLPDAAKLRCPHLALFGAAEKNVPVADSVAAFARAACQRDSSLTVEVFPGADHRIRIAEAFAPRYLATLTRWISTVHERGYQHLP